MTLFLLQRSTNHERQVPWLRPLHLLMLMLLPRSIPMSSLVVGKRKQPTKSTSTAHRLHPCGRRILVPRALYNTADNVQIQWERSPAQTVLSIVAALNHQEVCLGNTVHNNLRNQNIHGQPVLLLLLLLIRVIWVHLNHWLLPIISPILRHQWPCNYHLPHPH